MSVLPGYDSNTQNPVLGFKQFLKVTYSGNRPRFMFELHTPWMKSLKRETIDEGQVFTWMVPISAASGFGNDLSAISGGTAGDPGSGTRSANFTLNTGNDYAVLQIDNKFLARGKKPSASFIEQLKAQVDGNIQAFGVQYARKLAQDGSGTLCKISSLVVGAGQSGTTLTLVNPNDVKYFQANSYVSLMAEGSGVPSGTPSARISVTSVNDAAGTLTIVDTAIANATYVYIGLANVAGRTDNVVGLKAWIPLTVAASTAVGVISTTVTCSHTRTLHEYRLAGHRLTGKTSVPIDDLIYQLASTMFERGSTPDRVLMSFNTYSKIAARQWNRIGPATQEEAKKLGIGGLCIRTSGGELPLVADSTIDDDRVYLIKNDTWRLVQLVSGLPDQITEASGEGGFFQLTGDAVELRYRAWGNLACMDPFQNGVIQVDSTAFVS